MYQGRNFFNNSDLKLLRKDGSTVKAVEALKDVDYVLMYFSAHWCPPCRVFTPLLKKFYDTHHVTKKFEVVFLSLDNSEEEMMSYYREEHGDYYCLPYADARGMKRVWADSYKFKSIPTLLVFENSCPRKLVARCGRDMVARDPTAETFPWLDADATQSQTSMTDYLRIVGFALLAAVVLYSLLTRS